MTPDLCLLAGFLLIVSSLFAVYHATRGKRPPVADAADETPPAEPVYDWHEFGDPGA